jgi:hypothetical protein
MRHQRLLWLALVTVFGYGGTVVASASAIESGLLYLPGNMGPVVLKGISGAKQTLKQVGLKTNTITATEVEFEEQIGVGEGTHSTLGGMKFTYKGVKLEAVACESENAKGEKDAKEVVLLLPQNTDVHTVALENLLGGLFAALLVGLLEEENHDLTLNCAGTKVLVLGALFLAMEASPTSDIMKTEILPVMRSLVLECDKSDKLCTKLIEKWDATATFNNNGKDEKVRCPLAVFIQKEEECAELKSEASIPAEFTKNVLVDF